MLLSPPANAQEANNLTLGIVSMASATLNPFYASEREFRSLTSLVYEGLVALDDDMHPQPCLAKSWEMSQDGGTWYFHLRDNVSFHPDPVTGEVLLLTADDVVASAKAILELASSPNGPGAYASLKYLIKDISANDAGTVVVKTDRRNYGFLWAMTFPVLPAGMATRLGTPGESALTGASPAQPSEAGDGSETAAAAENTSAALPPPPGTGPYLVPRGGFSPKDYLLLNANLNWWNGVPKYASIMTVFHETSQKLISSYEYNRVDTVLTRSLNAAQYRGGTNSFNISYRTPQLETLLMNNHSNELKDVRMRRAIRSAVNVQDLLSVSYMGMAQRADTPMMPGTWAYNDIPGVFEYDPRKSAQLLEEMGWTEFDDTGVRTNVVGDKLARLHLTFIVYEEQDNNVRVMAANRIVSALQGLGIECKLEQLSYSACKERLKAGTYDLALAAFNMDPVPDPGFLLMSGNTGNFARYSSKEMDNLFSLLRKTTDEETYRNTLFQIQSLFAEDCPFVCLYYRRGAILTRQMFTEARELCEPNVLRGLPDAPTAR